jgi:hypothetical protein
MPAGAGFSDPALAAPNSEGNLYFEQDLAVATKLHGSPIVEQPGMVHGQVADTSTPSLIFGGGTATTSSGEAIVSAANSTRGHWSEIFNFHGSPAPWVLIGILLAAGLLHLSANAKFKGEL